MLRIPPKWVSAGMLLTMSCIFSLSFLFATLASMEVGPAASGSTRIVFAAIFLVIAAQITGVGLVRGRQLWAYAAIYGIICLGLPFTLLPWTLTYVSNTTAAIYYAAIPLEVLVLSRIVIGTPISRQKWAGFAIASAGLLLLAHIGAQGDAGASQAVVEQLGVTDRLAENQLWIPHLLCNLCALCLAGGGVLFQIMPRVSPLAMTASALLLGNIVAVPVLMASLPLPMPSPAGWAWIVGSGFLVTGCGTLLRGALIRREGAVYTSTNGYIVPLITGAMAFLFLKEPLAPVAMFAYLLVVGGLLVSRREKAPAA